MFSIYETEDLCCGNRSHGRCIADTGIVVDENKAEVKFPFLLSNQSYRTVEIHNLSKVVPVRICYYKKRICRFVTGNNRYNGGFFELVNQVQCDACLHGYLRAPEYEECRSCCGWGFA